MGELKIILGIAILSVIQLFLSKYKIGKWILPCISFAFSICLVLFGLSFATLMEGDNFLKEFGLFNLIRLSLKYNVPTIIYLLINRYRRKKNEE